jgi:hypothetical protein
MKKVDETKKKQIVEMKLVEQLYPADPTIRDEDSLPQNNPLSILGVSQSLTKEVSDTLRQNTQPITDTIPTAIIETKARRRGCIL